MKTGKGGVQMDILTARPVAGGGVTFAGDGTVAKKLLASGFNINALRTNDTLRRDEWKQFDDRLIEVARKKLVIVGQLQSRGLTYPITNGLGKTILQWEQISDMEPAEVSMSGVTPGQRDGVDFTQVTMPLPIIHKDFQLNIRHLMASRERGEPLDMTQSDLAMTLVMETIEEMVFIGNAMTVGGSTIYGLTTHGSRNTGSVTASWDLSTTTGDNKLDDVMAMMNALIADNMYGPYGLYVTTTAYTYLMDDFKTNSDKSQIVRLLEIPNLDFITPSKDVPAGAVIMVQLDRNTIDEVVGLQPTVVEWETNGGMTFNFKVMAIMIPRVRATVTGQSGIAHYS